MNRVPRRASTAATMPVAVAATATVAVPVATSTTAAVAVASAAVCSWRWWFGGAPTAGLGAVGQRPLGRLPCTGRTVSASGGSAGLGCGA